MKYSLGKPKPLNKLMTSVIKRSQEKSAFLMPILRNMCANKSYGYMKKYRFHRGYMILFIRYFF